MRLDEAKQILNKNGYLVEGHINFKSIFLIKNKTIPELKSFFKDKASYNVLGEQGNMIRVTVFGKLSLNDLKEILNTFDDSDVDFFNINIQ